MIEIQLEALLILLIRKGIITKDEFIDMAKEIAKIKQEEKNDKEFIAIFEYIFGNKAFSDKEEK